VQIGCLFALGLVPDGHEVGLSVDQRGRGEVVPARNAYSARDSQLARRPQIRHLRRAAFDQRTDENRVRPLVGKDGAGRLGHGQGLLDGSQHRDERGSELRRGGGRLGRLAERLGKVGPSTRPQLGSFCELGLEEAKIVEPGAQRAPEIALPRPAGLDPGTNGEAVQLAGELVKLGGEALQHPYVALARGRLNADQDDDFMAAFTKASQGRLQIAGVAGVTEGNEEPHDARSAGLAARSGAAVVELPV
jgi:hypothetical protein